MSAYAGSLRPNPLNSLPLSCYAVPPCSTMAMSPLDGFGTLPAIKSPTFIEKGMAYMGRFGFNAKEPLEISPSIIIVSNPMAGNGKAKKYVKGLVNAARSMTENGALHFNGDVSRVATDANFDQRIAQIKEAIINNANTSPPYVIAVGGDGTFADVGMAALQVFRDEGLESIIIPAPAGTARDMSRELGVPSDPSALFDFIATATRVKLGAISVYLDGGPERVLMHSLGFGVSGAFFHEVQKVRDNGDGVTVAAYLKALVKGVYETKPFYVSVDGSDKVSVGEVLTLFNSTSVGGVTRVPLPIHGGRIHLIPVDMHGRSLLKLKQGVAALGDVFERGISYMLGRQSVISPGEEISVLSGKYTMDIKQGDQRKIEFFDVKGKVHAVKGVLNGDTVGDVSRISMANNGEGITSLASPGCAFFIRKGESRP